MAAKYINLKVKIGGSSGDLEKAFSMYDSQIAQFDQVLNRKDMEDEVKLSAIVTLRSANFRVKGLTKELVDKFKIREVKSGSGKKIRKEFTLYHDWFLRSYAPVRRNSTGKIKHEISRRSIYKIVDLGRKQFEIPSKKNYIIAKNPLRFYWKKMSRFETFLWKGPRGGRKRFLVVKQNSNIVNFKRGSQVTNAAYRAMEEYVDREFANL